MNGLTNISPLHHRDWKYPKHCSMASATPYCLCFFLAFSITCFARTIPTAIAFVFFIELDDMCYLKLKHCHTFKNHHQTAWLALFVKSQQKISQGVLATVKVFILVFLWHAGLNGLIYGLLVKIKLYLIN